MSATEVASIYNDGVPINVASNLQNYSSASNLFGYWDMNEGDGDSLTDSSSNSNTATLKNDPTWSNDSWNTLTKQTRNYSIDFDGSNDYIDIGSLSALSSISAFTISFWFKNNGNSSGNVFGAWGSSSNNNIGLNPNYTGNIFYFVVRAGSAAGALSVSSLGTYAPTNDWNHFVCVFDGGDRVVYITGVSRASDSGVAPSTAFVLVVIVALENPPIVPDKAKVEAPFGASLLQFM